METSYDPGRLFRSAGPIAQNRQKWRPACQDQRDGQLGEMLRPALEKARDKGRQSTVGPKGYDVILLFKILILQSL